MCSGDLSALGTVPELAFARRSVDPFFEAPLGFLCIPGNHDLYTRSVVRERRFETCFAEGLETDLPGLCVDGPWPVVRLLGDVAALVAVNSARPVLPWQSSGRVPAAQLDGLRAALEHQALAGRFVLAVTHYAPLTADGTPDTRLHGLENADAFLAACAGIRRGAILCGHIHHAFRYTFPDGGCGPSDLFCGGSATYEGREAAWWFDIAASGTVVRPVRWDGAEWSLPPAETAVPVG